MSSKNLPMAFGGKNRRGRKSENPFRPIQVGPGPRRTRRGERRRKRRLTRRR